MIHNRCVCRCKLVIDLASKVLLLMWKHICNHFNTSPGILFEIGAPCLENVAWIWFRNLRPAYKGNSGTWAPRSPNDTIKNRSSIQFKIIFCPLVIVVSSEALVGAHRCQANLCQEGFLSPRWLMGDGWWEEQGRSPGVSAIHLASGDQKLIFCIPDISTNWLAGHDVSNSCCFPASPSLMLWIHISAPEIVFSDPSVVWWVLFCPTQQCPNVNNIQTKTRAALTPADMSQGQVKLLSTTWRKGSGQT